jgi:hypothetical protein
MSENTSREGGELLEIEGEPTPSVPVDVVFANLAHPGRRFVLTYLLREDRTVGGHELVEYVVEQSDPPEGLTRAQFRGHVATSLYQTHLPKLADNGLIAHDPAEQTATATEATRAVEPYLEIAARHGR